MSSSSNSPCAACKLLRRKCTQECVFGPYFPPDNPQRFACVHRVFGASNVSKLLSELSVAEREDAVKSLAYEAEARLRDPVYGCVGFISLLQQRLRQIQTELHNAKKELSTYIITPNGIMLPPPAGVVVPHNAASPSLVLGGQMVIREPQQQEVLEAQQMGFATTDQHQHQQQQEIMLQNYEQQHDLIKLNSGGFGNQWELLSPSLGLGNYEDVGSYQVQQQAQQQHHPIEAQLLFTPQQHHPESEDGMRSVVPT